ncbi:MAG: DNA-directed polymerase beta subunit, partial [Acidobacteria bacterium]|nr:DNA-directed polymerase beta subunit [Acidobacteriota bacterium]
PLDGGRFATSDLNDLYRRVINRNNRLKRLIELKAPDIIVRNEKRMLQEAVDALFDNGRRGRVITGANKRPLKSLSDMLKGKQGRFRQNLLGKRVDYSGRSVIVVGPELKLHQCGLPKKMALELFKPFIYNRLEQKGLVGTIKAAKEMVELQQTEVWDALEEVIKEHPVLLNRAPTLHRLGIQAFEPVLVEGKAIKIHPLVCTAFNADFDGDQMAVHVPLSPKAQVECQVLMLASNNILSPAHGKPLAVPSQDLVLGCYYLTKAKKGAKGEGKAFGSFDEVELALANGEVELLTPIRMRVTGRLIDLTTQFNDQDIVHAEIQDVNRKLIDSTVGRVILNMHLPDEIPFINGLLKKKGLQELVNYVFLNYGNALTVKMLDDVKDLGFLYATKAGVSVGIDDMVIPSKKGEIVDGARTAVLEVERQRLDGAITAGERHNKIIDIWHRATETVSDEMFAEMKRVEEERGEFNPIFMMADSGARGSKEQVRQLAGMRGLMSKPSGEVIETPITANFREGLSVLQYLISTHGARKGLADTALKTADSGYLTRRLVDVAQDVIVTEEDCQTFDGINVSAIMEGGDILEPLRDRVVGRVVQEDIYDPLTGKLIVSQNQEVTEELANEMQEAGIERAKIRSGLTCETRRGICRRCYGRNLASGKLVEIGEAVGVIAAESIGEPGTQLTMRTFHVGGTASRVSEQSKHEATNPGRVTFVNVSTVTNKNGDLVVINRNGKLLIVEDTLARKAKKGEIAADAGTREKERYALVYGATLRVHDNQHVEAGQPLVEWDPFTSAILTEVGGKVTFKDIVEGENVREETDRVTGLTQMVIVESSTAEKRTPTITVKSKKGEEKRYLLPTGAHVMVQNGNEVYPGDILAKIPRATTKTKDITGGLPRVVELFEARHPREKAVISEVDGTVHHGPIVKGLRRVIVETDEGTRHEYSVPRSVHVNVQEGERVRAGDPLIDGPIDPHDVLAVLGIKELQRYLVDKIQEVYRSQSVAINDKHIEVICRQMLRSVRVTRVGDTDFLVDEQVDRFRFMEENEKVMNRGGEPADGTPLLLGITKASLSTDSFISAASFQETTRVLTEAAIAGRVDYLRGLKENVIVGRLIPAGTGMPVYREVFLEKDEPAPQPNLEDLLRPEDEEALTLADFDDEQ